jgi:hypothetical protein
MSGLSEKRNNDGVSSEEFLLREYEDGHIVQVAPEEFKRYSYSLHLQQVL